MRICMVCHTPLLQAWWNPDLPGPCCSTECIAEGLDQKNFTTTPSRHSNVIVLQNRAKTSPSPKPLETLRDTVPPHLLAHTDNALVRTLLLLSHQS